MARIGTGKLVLLNNSVHLARSKGGLGLGLALSKSLAEMHSGRLSVESPGAGLGATFTLCLPLDTTILAPAATPATAPVHRSRRVPVIEDNDDAARTLAEAFHAYEVCSAI